MAHIRKVSDIACAFAGALVLLSIASVNVYLFVPADPSSLLVGILNLPLMLWSLGAMANSGKLAGLSLSPSEIWKPALLSAVIVGILAALAFLVNWYQDSIHAGAIDVIVNGFIFAIYSGFIDGVLATSYFSIVIGCSVASRRPYRMKIQFRSTLAGALFLAAGWLAISLLLPIAIRDSISELAGERAYSLYVPDPADVRSYRPVTEPLDIWTFQSLLTARLEHRCHMYLVLQSDDGATKDYHWSFFSGFRFVENTQTSGC